MEASAELSDIARALHPAVLSERGLAASLQALTARCELPVHLRALPGRRYSEVIEMTAYLSVGEALVNAVRHAHATECSLLASDDAGVLVIEVRDNGIGGAELRPGSGLEWMADRSGAIGARFALESPRGGGTAIRLEIPV
jgi:signal transduction histidine kinase